MSGYPNKVSQIAFDDTGRWLAVNGAPDITVWDFSGSGPGGTRPAELTAHTAVTSLAWKPGDSRILASHGTEGRLAIWPSLATVTDKPRHPQATRQIGDGGAILHWLGPTSMLIAAHDGTVTKLDDL